MALSLNFSVTQASDCKSIVFKDTTGIYNADTNTGGYGTPNSDETDITATSITVRDENNVSYTALTTYDIDSGDYTVGDPYPLTINSTDLSGLSGELNDGVWTITYKVYTGVSVLQDAVTKKFLLYCNASTCVSKMILKECTNQGCLCDDILVTANSLRTLIEAANVATGVGMYDCAEKNIARVLAECKRTNCKDCG